MKNITIRDIALLLIIGFTSYLAIVDENFRPTFGQISSGIVGAYFGLSLPENRDHD
jgi:hypothetical protein